MALKALITTIIASLAIAAHSQRCSIGFYNTENLMDTIPSLFYNDTDFTPQGAKSWDSARYNTKITNIAQVVDHMALDIIALAEVENEGVVRSLVTTLKTDYNYIHRTTNDSRGLDIALLYKGDKFIPEMVRQVDLNAPRQGLYVRGRLLGVRIDIIAVHLPSHLRTNHQREASLKRLYRWADSLRISEPGCRLVVMGDMNADPREKIMKRAFHTSPKMVDAKIFLFNPLGALSGMGTYVWQSNWTMLDNIFLSTAMLGGEALAYQRGAIFVRDYMLQGDGKRRGTPLPSFSQGRYTAGYSDHLPVFVELEKSGK